MQQTISLESPSGPCLLQYMQLSNSASGACAENILHKHRSFDKSCISEDCAVGQTDGNFTAQAIASRMETIAQDVRTLSGNMAAVFVSGLLPRAVQDNGNLLDTGCVAAASPLAEAHHLMCIDSIPLPSRATCGYRCLAKPVGLLLQHRTRYRTRSGQISQDIDWTISTRMQVFLEDQPGQLHADEERCSSWLHLHGLQLAVCLPQCDLPNPSSPSKRIPLWGGCMSMCTHARIHRGCLYKVLQFHVLCVTNMTSHALIQPHISPTPPSAATQVRP